MGSVVFPLWLITSPVVPGLHPDLAAGDSSPFPVIPDMGWSEGQQLHSAVQERGSPGALRAEGGRQGSV